MPASDDATATPAEFTITRDFAAPRALIWRAWTDPALLARWFGPKGVTTQVLRHELRPGGLLHGRMTTPLVWVHSFSDPEANVADSPFGGHWPRQLLTTVSFEDSGAATRVTLHSVPLDASAEERAAFAANLGSMNMGWGGSFEVLDEVLASLAGPAA